MTVLNRTRVARKEMKEVGLAWNPFVVLIFVDFPIFVSILVPIFVGFSSCLLDREHSALRARNSEEREA